MYRRFPPDLTIPSLLDMPPVDRPEHARHQEREQGNLHDPGTNVRHHHQGAPLLNNPEQTSNLGDHDFRPPLLSAPSSSYSERQVHHLPVPQPRGQPPSHHAMLQDSPTEMYRERERHLDFSSGKRVLIDDDNLYVSPAPTYQRNLMSREKSRSIEMERQEREIQRQADLQRRAELQRELEMERENLRIQKEEEERELERQRKRESERQREAERQRELERQREMERKREVERKRQREIERERERERQRQAEEEEDRKRQMEQERERLRLQLEREQREREIQRQQEMIREREMKIQQEYEENEQRMQFERGQRVAMDCDQEFHHMREMDMLREREAALEQEMAFRDQRRPPRQDIPSLLTMPKVAPSATMKKGLLGDINDGLDDALMEKVKLQQAMLAQQTSGNTNQKPNQNRQGRNRRSQRKRVNQQMREGNRNANKGSNNSQNQRQNRQKQNNKKQSSGKDPAKGAVPGPKTPPWLKEGAFDSSQSKTEGSKPDLYDPLHPTDDEENGQDLKRKHSDGELQVRIHRDNDDRDVLDPPQKKHAGAKLEIPSSGSIHPTKEMLYQMRPKMSASLEWICHVCNVKCHEVMNYHQHMMGKRHQAMMSHITEVAEAKTDEAFKTLRAEGHVDRIRRGFESHRPSSKNVQQTYFCDVCTTYIFCEREAHNRSEEHQTALKVMERRCKVCNKSFKSLSAFMNHCNTINHRMSFEVQQEKGKIEATKIVEESKKLKKRRDKVFVTVDEVGYEPDDNKAVKKTNSDDGTLPDPKQETKSKPEVVTLKGSSEQSQPIVAVLSADPVPSVQSEPKDLATPDILNPTPSSQLSLPSFENVLEEMKKEPEPWSMQDLVSYNPNSIVGQEYVIPVTGFFCKLCRKFYNSENSARVIHCKSQAHFTNLKKLYEEMQLAAQITKEVKDPKEESSKEESFKDESSKDESSEQEECQGEKEETAKDTKPESEDKKKETVIKQEDAETVESVTADTESKPEEEPLSPKEDADEESKVEK